MITFDGTYRLQREKDASAGTFSKNPCSWRIRIINLSMGQPDIKHLRPIVVVASRTGDIIYPTTCAESMGRKICRDFDLDIRTILWVEHYPGDPEPVFVACFTPKTYFDYDILYTITWRAIRPNELKAIKPFISELEFI